LVKYQKNFTQAVVQLIGVTTTFDFSFYCFLPDFVNFERLKYWDFLLHFTASLKNL